MNRIKQLFLTLLFAFGALAAHAQDFDLGLKVMPNMAFNRLEDMEDEDPYQLDNNSLGVRFGLGVMADYFMGDNYALNMGLNFLVKRASTKYSFIDGGVPFGGDDNPFGSEMIVTHNIQYVQLPVGMKFYTNEVMLDSKIYFNVAGTIDIKVAENMIEAPDAYKRAYEYENHYRPLDFGAILAIGGEMELGSSTKAFAGFFYNRNFLSIVRDEVGVDNNESGFEERNERRKDLEIRLSQIGIEAGIKF